MHPSLSTALTSLDEYIAYLSEIRSQLSQGGKAQALAVAHIPKTQRRQARRGHKSQSNNDGSARKNEVAQFIKAHGPSKRGEIKAGTKVPAGTLAYVLNDKTRFIRLADGRWDNKAA